MLCEQRVTEREREKERGPCGTVFYSNAIIDYIGSNNDYDDDDDDDIRLLLQPYYIPE